MRRPKIVRDFSPRRYNDMGLQMRALTVIERMTGNPHFPDPKPSITELKQATKQYAESLTTSNEGTKADTVVKKNNRLVLQRLLYNLAIYVEIVCEGNAAMILNSGFQIQKDWTVIGPLPQPTGFSVRQDSQSGSVIVQCDVLKKVKLYLFQYTMDPLSKDSIWNSKHSTKHTVRIDGLEIEKPYYFRVAGAASDPARNYTDCIRKMVI